MSQFCLQWENRNVKQGGQMSSAPRAELGTHPGARPRTDQKLLLLFPSVLELFHCPEGSSGEKDPETLVDNRLIRSQPYALVAKKVGGLLGCTTNSVDSRWREVLLLFCPAEATSGVMAPVRSSPVQEGKETAGESPLEGHGAAEEPGASL